MEARAVAKFVRMSSSKLKPVTDLVRGKDLAEALTILKFTPGKGSELVEKVVQSAAANAENNHEMNTDALYVAEISANQGPTMKRWRPGARGRAGMILKRTSHINVVLKERENFKPEAKADTAAAKVDEAAEADKAEAKTEKVETKAKSTAKKSETKAKSTAKKAEDKKPEKKAEKEEVR
jgi:large subunit ribosomal protein L22